MLQIREIVEAGALTLTEEDLALDALESWQPNQSRRKKAVPLRLAATSDAGLPMLAAPGSQLGRAGAELSVEQRQAEYDGTISRISRGAHRDPMGYGGMPLVV